MEILNIKWCIYPKICHPIEPHHWLWKTWSLINWINPERYCGFSWLGQTDSEWKIYRHNTSNYLNMTGTIIHSHVNKFYTEWSIERHLNNNKEMKWNNNRCLWILQRMWCVKIGGSVWVNHHREKLSALKTKRSTFLISTWAVQHGESTLLENTFASVRDNSAWQSLAINILIAFAFISYEIFITWTKVHNSMPLCLIFL